MFKTIMHSANTALAGQVVYLFYGDRINNMTAQGVVVLLMMEMYKEFSTSEYQMQAVAMGLPPVPEGYIILERVLEHLELELRRN